MLVAAGAGGGIPVLRPRVPVAGAVRQRAERATQPLVAAPSGTWPSCACRTRRRRRRLGRRRRQRAHGSRRAEVADLRQQLGGGRPERSRVAKQRQEDLTIGVLAQRRRSDGSLLDLLDQWLDRCASPDRAVRLAPPGLGGAGCVRLSGDSWDCEFLNPELGGFTLRVMRDGRPVTVEVASDGAGLVSRAGTALLGRVADKLGLTSALSLRLAGLKQRRRGP